MLTHFLPVWAVVLLLQAAIIVAVLNIQIPLLLGDLVNVVAALEPGQPMRDYFERLLRPGLRLAVNYIAQVRWSLSNVDVSTGYRCTVYWRVLLQAFFII